MARNNIAVRKSYPVALRTAVDNLAGAGASLMVRASEVIVLPPPNSGKVVQQYNAGVEIDRIRVQPVHPIGLDTFIRFFLEAPGRGTFLIHEQRIPAGTLRHAPLAPQFAPPYGAIDLTDRELNGPIVLNPGYALLAACLTADPFDVIAYGGEYTDTVVA